MVKIPHTEERAREAFAARFRNLTTDASRTKEAWKAAVISLDLEFKEEPELPKRIRLLNDTTRCLFDGKGYASLETYREAVARYNAWEDLLCLLEGMKRGAINVEEVTRRVRASLESERERLQ